MADDCCQAVQNDCEDFHLLVDQREADSLDLNVRLGLLLRFAHFHLFLVFILLSLEDVLGFDIADLENFLELISIDGNVDLVLLLLAVFQIDDVGAVKYVHGVLFCLRNVLNIHFCGTFLHVESRIEHKI